MLAQHSRAITQVLPEVFQAPEARAVAISFFRLRDAAETQERCAPRLLFAHPSANVLRSLHLQMKLQFAIQLAFAHPSPQQCAQAMKQLAKHSVSPIELIVS